MPVIVRILRLALIAALALSPVAIAGVTGTLSSQAGEIRDLVAIDGSTMYAASQGGGLWKSTNAGASWGRVNALPARYVWKVGFASSSPGTLYSATTAGLFVSGDAGASWSQRTFDPVRAVAASASGSTLLIGVPGAGVYRSGDGGASFVDVSSGLDSSDIRALVIDAAGNAFAALHSNLQVGWGGVFRLAAGATSWQSWNEAGGGGPFALSNRFVTGLALNGSVLLASTSDGTGSGAGKIYRNTLGGPGWNNPGSPGSGAIFDIESVAVDRSDASGHSFLAGTRAFGVWRSIDDGLTWVQKSTGGADSEAMQTTIAIGTLPGSGNAVIAQRGAGLFYTTGIASPAPSWQRASGLAADRVLSLANHANAAPSTYYLGLQGGGVAKSVNAGSTWSPLLAGFQTGGPDPLLGSAAALAAHPTDTNSVFAALRTTGLYSLSGNTWTRDPGAPSVLMPQDLRYDAGGSSLYYTIFNPGGGVFRRNAGSWSQVEPGVWAGSAGTSRVFASSNGAFIAMMFDQLPRRSATGAPGSWTTVAVAAAPNDTGFMRIAFSAIAERPGTGGATLVAATNRGLYRSGDNGQNWYRVTVAGPAGMSTALSALEYAGPLFAADRAGALYCSTNDGDTWLAAGQANSPVVALRYLNNQLLALTDGSGVAIVSGSCP